MQAFTALADATRRKIVEMLAAGERRAGEIAARFAISPPAISQHLKVLRKARLVRVRVEAQRRIYELDPAGLNELDKWLTQVERFWGGRLDTAERQLRGTHHNDSRRNTP